MKKNILLSLLFIEAIFIANAQIKPGGVSGSVLWLRADKGVTVDAENKLVSPYWEDFSDEKQGIELFQKEDGGLESLVLKENGVNGNPTVYFNGKVALKGLEDKNYQSVFAVYSANLTTENNSESTVLSIQEKGVTDYGKREDLAFFQTYKIGSNPTPTWLVSDGVNAYWGTRSTTVVDKATGFHSCFAAFGNVEGDMVTLDGGLFSVLTRFVSTPSKEGIFYVGVSVAGTTKIGKWLEGDIAEVIAFDRLVTDEERYKIESYLAAKYGITLIKSSSSNPVKVSGTPSYNYTYMSSTGETWWAGESTDYAPYSNYIAGIVRDDASGLMQSKSTGRIGYSLDKEGGILTISNGSSFAEPEAIAEDGQFAFVGATSDALDETESVRVINNEGKEIACKVLTRTWKINMSGIHTVSLQFAFSSEMVNLLAETPKVGLLKNGTEFIPLEYDEENMTMTADGIELTTGDTFTVVVDYIDKPQINSTSQKVCLESTISLSAVPEGGVWSGNGVEGNTFNALTAGLGEHTVVYTLNSMSDSIVFTVEESITPEVVLVSNTTESEEWDAIVIEAQTVTGGESPLFQFALDDPEFVYPLDIYSSNNVLRLAGYQLTEGVHTVYVRMKSSLPCVTQELATAQIEISKTATGIVVAQQASVACFPNPFDSEINISGLDSDKDYIMNFFSSNGELVGSVVCAAGQSRIEAPQLSVGVYIVQIIEQDSREKVAVIQLLKQ
ncbi:T9SS type A sorting domain-containing protein [Barnesiella viscericola]|uniref:T9SS type A sorting domain-containing protein n=1 Tax=Barnesiella viscericola TaxID=397865 RepID=A0A921MQG5_9BACT|nr:T9SS type A sorting domain-containing protein [Barnesiella viscericola]HJG88174.1 T9SS type A sorting domain-containing protein [Barnesiella viscericola]